MMIAGMLTGCPNRVGGVEGRFGAGAVFME
jgi:hypothetical protein